MVFVTKRGLSGFKLIEKKRTHNTPHTNSSITQKSPKYYYEATDQASSPKSKVWFDKKSDLLNMLKMILSNNKGFKIELEHFTVFVHW